MLFNIFNRHRQALEQQYLRGLVPSSEDGFGPLLPIITPNEDNLDIGKAYALWLDEVALNLTTDEVERNSNGTI